MVRLTVQRWAELRTGGWCHVSGALYRPKWDHLLIFDIKNDFSTLIVDVMDEVVGSDLHIGTTKIDLTKIYEKRTVNVRRIGRWPPSRARCCPAAFTRCRQVLAAALRLTQRHCRPRGLILLRAVPRCRRFQVWFDIYGKKTGKGHGQVHLILNYDAPEQSVLDALKAEEDTLTKLSKEYREDLYQFNEEFDVAVVRVLLCVCGCLAAWHNIIRRESVSGTQGVSLKPPLRTNPRARRPGCYVHCRPARLHHCGMVWQSMPKACTQCLVPTPVWMPALL